jgi:hypothetical protein
MKLIYFLAFLLLLPLALWLYAQRHIGWEMGRVL